MVKNKKTILAYLLCGAVLVALLGAFCMFLAVVGDYSPELGYFEKGSVKAGVLYAVLTIGVILAAVSWFLFRKSAPENLDIPSPIYTKIVSIALILTLLWQTATDLLHIPHDNPLLPHWSLILVSDLLALLFIVYLVCDSAPEKIRQSPLAACLGFFPPIYAATRLFIIYLDLTAAANSPVKILQQLMYISFMLFLTGAAGLSLKRGAVFPRYVFSLICTTAIGGALSVSAVLGLVTETPGYNMEPSQIAFCFIMTVYALCRLLTLALSDSVVLKSPQEDAE